MTREQTTPTISIDKADEPPIAFGELLDWIGTLTRDELAVAAHAARQMAEASERREKRQRKPSLKTVLDQTKKAGATSVTTPEGFTYTVGQAAEDETNLFELEAARLRRGT